MSLVAATKRRLPRAARATARPPLRDPITPRQVLWLAALIAAAQLPLARSVPVWAAVAGITLVGLRILLLLRDRMRPGAPPTRIPAWILVVCAAAVAGAVKVDYGYFLGRGPCIAFLYVLVAIKFLEARDPRDGALLVCLASFLVITPFFDSQSVLAAFAAVPAVLLIGAVHDVLAQHRAPAKAVTSWKAPIVRASRLLLHGIPLAAVLFVLFPRLATPLWGLPADRMARTGLSDRMSPGMISELSLSDAVAFRVDFDDTIPTPRQRYWRGPVLSRFDGREWTQPRQQLDGTIMRANIRSIGYAVTLEPHFKPWLFALDLPSTMPVIDVDPDAMGDPHTREVAGLTRSQELVSRTLVTQPLRYRQRSMLRDRYAADAARDAAENLQLPERGGDSNPKTLAFARALRADHPDDDDYIRTVLAWFTRESFVYTLAPPYLDRNAVDGFLFETRRGFCEHYAGAFVVLLRAAGIPARVVTGYQGGEINPSGGYMIVRQSDAHAWAEALVAGEWRRYDPTGSRLAVTHRIGTGRRAADQ